MALSPIFLSCFLFWLMFLIATNVQVCAEMYPCDMQILMNHYGTDTYIFNLLPHWYFSYCHQLP